METQAGEEERGDGETRRVGEEGGGGGRGRREGMEQLLLVGSAVDVCSSMQHARNIRSNCKEV